MAGTLPNPLTGCDATCCRGQASACDDLSHCAHRHGCRSVGDSMIIQRGLVLSVLVLTTSSAFAHSDGIAIRSTAAGGGMLAATGIDAEPIHAPLVFCSNGECLFVTEEGSILSPVDEDAAEGLHALVPDTAIRLEILSIDAGASLKVGGAKLDRAGESTMLGKAPRLHAHTFWQVEAPEGDQGEWRVVFRFKSPSTAYDPSPEYTITVTNAEPVATTSTSTVTVSPTSTSTSTTLGAATCGNGLIEGNEACDAGAEPWTVGRACDGSCRWVACGDPDGDGASLATDALFVLSAAVGVRSCDACLCNVDSSVTPAVSGADALRILRYAVGVGAIPLLCPACGAE